jgi:hypothetical protein
MVLVVVVLVLLVVVVIVVSDWLGEDGAIDTLHIVLVLEGRPGEEASEAKDISKEFQRVGKFFDGIMLAQLIDLGGGRAEQRTTDVRRRRYGNGRRQRERDRVCVREREPWP